MRQPYSAYSTLSELFAQNVTDSEAAVLAGGCKDVVGKNSYQACKGCS